DGAQEQPDPQTRRSDLQHLRSEQPHHASPWEGGGGSGASPEASLDPVSARKACSNVASRRLSSCSTIPSAAASSPTRSIVIPVTSNPSASVGAPPAPSATSRARN